MVRRGLARSRGHARDLLRDGAVTVDDRAAGKPATDVGDGSRIEVSFQGPVWVSRAAGKLLGGLAALDGPDVAGRRCLDVGASTGGFTQVLLDRGAAQVTALDVGTGQLVRALADDPRVVERSGVSVRGLTPADLGGRFDVVVADLSFISLRLVLDTLAGLLADDGDAVLLVKPQFEVGRSRLGKRGVVRSARDRRAALHGVLEAAEAAGLTPGGLAVSPVEGGEGNTEYLLRVGRGRTVGLTWQALAQSADRLTSEGPHDR